MTAKNGISETPKKKEKKVTVSVRMSVNDRRRFQILADLEDRTLNAKITQVLKDFIRQWEGALPDKKDADCIKEAQSHEDGSA